ncbi:MAG: 2-oxo acid dehydrogenase subunit E2 [Oscillospiraceae bacterium]|nr:2-oxo acid dehydrogenase subunit E2 [Oscillospiraceae bacterium]
MSEPKRRFGDRKDGTLLRDIDSMHLVMPLMYPNRCDNEAFLSERIDLTNVNAWLEQKNSSNPEYKYNLFQIMVTAMLKVLTLRPKMNRFIANCRMYQRNEVSAAFTIKKIFSDSGDEALAVIRSKETDTIDTIHQEIFRQVSLGRSEKVDAGTQSLNMIQGIPGFLLRFVGAVARFLDRRGWMPRSVIAGDPYQSSVVITNLGSIKLHAGYHHLTNWGTCSVFCVIGEAKKRPFHDETGRVQMRDSLDIGLTIDERIADGYYYSKTIRLLKKLLETPELLELPLNEKVEY